MLRRVLIPFSELFILLMMMFFALFFVSAALGGRGEVRPEDDIFILTISIQHNERRDDILNETAALQSPWMTRSIGHIAASDAASFEMGNWQNVWMSSGRPAEAPRVGTVTEAGACSTIKPFLYRHNNGAPTERNRPEQALRLLAGPGSKLMASTTLKITHSASNLLASLGLSPTLTHSLTITYRPDDIQRNLVIEAGFGIGYREPTRITVVREQLLGSERSVTELYLDGGGQYVQQDAQEPKAAPVFSSAESCVNRMFGSLRLYVMVTPEGMRVSTLPPERAI